MTSTLLVAVIAAAAPKEPSIEELVKMTLADACAQKAAQKPAAEGCAALEAFLRAKPTSTTAALLTMGTAFAVSARSNTWTSETGFVLSLKPGKPATATVFSIRPENDQERAEEAEFIARLGARTADKNAPLAAMMESAAKAAPRVDTKVEAGSLVFQFNRPLGGQWVRSIGKKVYVVGFGSSLESPELFIAQLPDTRP